MRECIFCDIIAGKAAASIVYQDDIVLALMNIGPANPGHVMVIPKEHISHLGDMDEGTAMHLFRITGEIIEE